MTESQYLSSSTLGSIPGWKPSIVNSLCATANHNDKSYLYLFIIIPLL